MKKKNICNDVKGLTVTLDQSNVPLAEWKYQFKNKILLTPNFWKVVYQNTNTQLTEAECKLLSL